MAVYFSFDFPPKDGGIARLGQSMCLELMRRGYELLILTANAAGGSPTVPTVARETPVSNRRPLRECQAYTWLRRNRNAGAVICGTWYPEGFVALLAGAQPLVILAHGLELMPAKAAWRRKLWRRLLRNVCESAQLVVSNSEYTRRLVLRSAPQARTVAIPLGVDHQRFSPKGRDRARRKFDVEGKLVLSSVARLHAYKGHDTVLEALAALPAAVRERFVYLIAGKGPHEKELRARALNRGISSRVRWLGFVSDDDLPDLYRASDLFVLCTHEAVERQEVEGFGLVFLEAQACGTPVVGSRCGGIPEAVREGEGGWLIEQGGVDDLVSILALLADRPEVFRAAGAAGRERVERECSWTHYVDRFTSALQAEGIQVV